MRPVTPEQQTEHVDTLVVGSGFGGAVTAYRLAEAGRRVVVLERGRPYPPGSFPRSPHEMGRSLWDPPSGLHGLFDVWSFSGFESIVSSGLGGGSLIYANVLLRKDEKWFVREDPLPRGGYETWPVTREDLDPHYDAVERMLTPRPYPFDTDPFAKTAKTQAMRDVAERLGMDWQLPPLAVAFASRPDGTPEIGATLDPAPYGNIHGLPRHTCVLDGSCDIGCNDGAKNSLDHTYLSAAKHHGAQIRTLCEVHTLRPRDGGGYIVDYVVHHAADDPYGAADELPEPTPRRITADRVVLGAGTYGTSYLLLRNRDNLPGLTASLGTRFSGNGDLISLLTPGTDRQRMFNASHGPVITSTIRVGDGLDPDQDDPGARGFYLQDGGYPGFVDWMVEPVRAASGLRAAAFVLDWLGRRLWPSADPHLSDEVARLIGDGSLSSGSLPLLGMGRDVPDGVISLRDDRLDVEWTSETSADYFSRMQETMGGLAAGLGTELRENPLWFFKRVITVHPLGGAPMGHDPSTGLCDDHGEVFGHPGLYVADGAAMPGPVGVNPSMTIAAHADRMSTGILEGRTERGAQRRRAERAAATGPSAASRPADASAATGPAATAGRRVPRRRTGAKRSGLSFTEEMRGHFAFDEQDPVDGAVTGRALGQDIAIHLTITIDDVDRFVHDPEHVASAGGWVESAALGGRLPVRRGWFNLFVAGPEDGWRRMVYRLHVEDPDGNPLTLVGRKEVRDDPGLDMWPDTTTLYTRLLAGHRESGSEDDGPVVGAGVLRLGEVDLLRQLTTFRTTGPNGPGTLLRFGRFFLGQLWDVYGRRAPDDPDAGDDPATDDADDTAGTGGETGGTGSTGSTGDGTGGSGDDAGGDGGRRRDGTDHDGT